MTANEPTTKNLADLYELAPLDWDDVRRELEGHLTQAPGSGGPGHHTFWLSTIDADGRPHITAVGAFWADGHYYFCGSPRSRKIRNVERDPRCGFGVAIHGYDVAFEGRAFRVTDEAHLERLARVFAEGGWAPTVADGGFTHEFSAPSAGPPPWFVYEFTPEDAYAVMTKEPGGATRWTF
ncbi:MAG TPA: pyridoxamine 5'-phosphate oxidase family protein [Acidimicrobiales bacterium]|nr:pyridoxamine 5'-phosphate oxidase family protein [Acidimicrobiales bacterium]